MTAPAGTLHALVVNERVKLFAAFLSACGVASLTVGLLGPLAAEMYRLGGTTVQSPWAGTILWITLAIVLHGCGQRVLGELR